MFVFRNNKDQKRNMRVVQLVRFWMCSSIVTSLNHLPKTKSCTYCDIRASKMLRVFLGLVEVKLKKKKEKKKSWEFVI